MSNSYEEHKREVSGGLWQFVGDIVVVWYGLALVYFIGGLVLVGVFETSEWIFGPDLGWKVGTWIVATVAIVLAAASYKAWWKRELRRRELERKEFLEDMERMLHL